MALESKEGLSDRVLIGVLGFVVSLEPNDEETEGESGIVIRGTRGADSGGWGCSIGGLAVKLLADVIVERKLLFLSFLLFLPGVDSGRGEPVTAPEIATGTLPFPER